MASKGFEKGSPEWYMFKDFWRLAQEFYTPEESDEYWKNFIDAADVFYEKHKNIPLAKELALALASTLEGPIRRT